MNNVKYQKIVIIYALIGVLWIVGSDWLLARVWYDFEDSITVSIIKGICFVLLMSAVLYILLKRLSVAELMVSASKTDEQLLLYKIPNYFRDIPMVTYAIEIDERRNTVVWISESITKVLGYSLKQAMVPGWWERCLHPEDRLRAQEESKQIILAQGGHHYYRLKRADGGYVNIHDELSAVKGTSPQRFIGILHDVSTEEDALNQVKHYSVRLENTVLGTVKAISSMIEMRDPYTAGHESRVGELAVKIAQEMGLNADTQYGLRLAGLVHDIGKINVPSEYLTKPTRLTESEFNIIKTHPENGFLILKNVEFPWPIAEVAHQHHERMDGSGYPQGLKGDNILLEARIIAVADVIESMATSRPYRHALGLDTALAEIEKNAGKLYDKNVTEATLRLFRDKHYQMVMKV